MPGKLHTANIINRTVFCTWLDGSSAIRVSQFTDVYGVHRYLIRLHHTNKYGRSYGLDKGASTIGGRMLGSNSTHAVFLRGLCCG